jgi:signal transduction histidine kinase
VSVGLRSTYSRRGWLATVLAAQTMIVGTISFVVMVALVATGAPLLLLALVGLPLLWTALVFARGIARFDAWRFEVYLGEPLVLRPPPRPRPSDPAPKALARGWARVRSGGSWLEACHALIAVPLVGWVGGSIVFTAWGAGVAFVLFPAYGYSLDRGERVFGVDLGYPGSVVLHVAVGVAALLAAPWLARGMAWVQLALARWLLSPGDTEALNRRVIDLESSRAGMVSAAAAERRRIERDLHDGAQQRLVSVAMTLGRAQERFADDPAAAHELVAEAHSETKRALVELRDLARGIYPAVLTDRGLEPALAGLAARCPVPVTLDIDVRPRPNAEIEAVAYFFVAETLTNIARHARASVVRVAARRVEDTLTVEVIDDGRGGAREDGGTGLAGLRDRALAVDGGFAVTSTPGVGTTVRLDLPCAP